MRISRPAGILLRQPASSGLQTGADPAVLTGSFNVQAYATAGGFGTIPAEQGATKDPLNFGATGDGVADDTTAVQNALNDIPTGTTGGVLDLSNGIFGVFRNTDDVIQIGDRSNITIKGGGWSDGVAQTSGLKVLSNQNPTGNSFDAVLRLGTVGNNLNRVIKDLEIDCNDRSIGGITHENDVNTWIINCYIHNVGGGAGVTGPAAAIRGINTQTTMRWIGNRIANTSELSGGTAPRGIWSSNDTVTDSVQAHNICTDISHSGLILHAGNGPTNIIELNTIVRAGLTAGAAGIKPELDGTIDVATFDIPQSTVIAIWRLNYIDIQRSLQPNNGPFCMQPETMNAIIENNILRDALQGCASFDRSRKTQIINNVMELMEEFGIRYDVKVADNTDKTGLLFNNNTISGDGEGMTFGIEFGSGFKGTNFGFNDPITVDDNLIPDAVSGSLNVDTDVQNYVNFSESGNGPSGAGAQNVLLPPSYAGSL